ncbi:molybdate ABC transporter permease subunit [Polynucleobacter sp. IMCC 29146]|nr:molybdate ABC transporter permease subunit [Polynucleobacter sp. IMCC 29146]
MDTQAIFLSLQLAFCTLLIILPLGIWLAHHLVTAGRWKPWLEALLALPLVLPPTVLGYYLLVGFSGKTLFGEPLVFSFLGILIASLIVNLPFAVQPIQRAFEAIPNALKEAAEVCGLNAWQIFYRINLPLAWRGVLSAAVLTFAHTLGEFGVILMIGGAIPGKTKTASIAIYDQVQSFNVSGAGLLSLLLLGISLCAIVISYGFFGANSQRRAQRIGSC